MIEIGENYYLINKEEITSDMVLLTDGIYVSGETYYEVVNNRNEKSTTSQNLNKNQASINPSNKNQTNTIPSSKNKTSTIATNNYVTFLFVFSVLFLAFAVLCIYLGINYIVEYTKIIDQSNQFGVLGETIVEQTSDLLRDGVLWIIGGLVSLTLGGFLSFIYHSKK